MKKLSMFLSGVVTTLLAGSICITAIAASESWTITVNPINIQVNGETFQPTNVQGNPVPVFAYNGTTYAPVRALAEAYGLEVGYDPETNMATVNDPKFNAQQSIATENFNAINITEINIDGERYVWNVPGGSSGVRLYTATLGGKEEVFAHVVPFDFGDRTRLTGELPVIIFACLEDNISYTESDNPYELPSLKIPLFYNEYDKYFEFGQDQTVYISATEFYTPTWISRSGKKVYLPTSNLDQSNTNIRHNGNLICVNDVLKELGIYKSVSIENKGESLTLVIK